MHVIIIVPYACTSGVLYFAVPVRFVRVRAMRFWTPRPTTHHNVRRSMGPLYGGIRLFVPGSLFGWLAAFVVDDPPDWYHYQPWRTSGRDPHPVTIQIELNTESRHNICKNIRRRKDGIFTYCKFKFVFMRVMKICQFQWSWSVRTPSLEHIVLL
jgi:hypothetical protein